MAEENKKQTEYTEDVMKGMLTDLEAGIKNGFVSAVKGLGSEMAGEFKQSLKETLAEMKAPARKQSITMPDDNGEDERNGVSMPRPYKSIGDFLQDVHASGVNKSKSEGLAAIEKAATGLGEAIPSDGGFMMQDDFAELLQKDQMETNIILGKTMSIPISSASNGIKIPAIDETSRAAGSRWGGVRAYWVEEGDAPTATKPKFRLMELRLKKMAALCYASEEMLQDSTALGSIISRAYNEEMGFILDDAFINGDGAGKPLGILNASCLVSVAKETGQAAATVEPKNIMKMWARMYGRSRAKAVWHLNQDVEPELFDLSLSVGTGGVPVYMPAGGLSQSPYSQLLGRPIVPLEQCKTVGTVGDILLCDWSQYVTITKGGVRAASSVHVRFTQDESTFKFVYRIDGQPLWRSALTPAQGSNTQSPFVALATRA